MANIVVLGSIVADISVWLDRSPLPGETIVVVDSGIFAGGKGLNQAAQAARLGAKPLLVGMVGEDALGAFMRQAITQELGTADGIITRKNVTTSYAIPVIEPRGQHIIHVPGANAAMTPQDVLAQIPSWGQPQFLLVQGEVNSEATLAAMTAMAKLDVTIVLDPAPMENVTSDMLEMATIMTPNQVEFTQLVGAEAINEKQWLAGIQSLMKRYPRLQCAIITLGSQGAFAANRGGWHQWVKAQHIHAVDPTAAGDAFNGAWAWAMMTGHSFTEAVQLGVRVGTLVASRRGALPSLANPSEL